MYCEADDFPNKAEPVNVQEALLILVERIQENMITNIFFAAACPSKNKGVRPFGDSCQAKVHFLHTDQ